MGSNESGSSSRPLTGPERAEAYNYGVYSITSPGLGLPTYNRPGIERLTDGDYNRLEQNIVDSRTAPLNRAWDLERQTINQDMADRGLWASGIPAQAMQKRYEEAYLPQFKAAGADAAAQRYAMQADELAKVNQANMTLADKEFDAKYRPYDYKAGLYNNTGGVVSSGGTSGWSI